MDGVASIPRWQGFGGPSAAGSLLAAGSLAAGSPMAGSPHRGLHRRPSSVVQTGKGWPNGFRPLFLDEIPPRLEECRERIAAVDRDLGRISSGKGISPDDSLPVSSGSVAGEPESEISPSARWRSSMGLGSAEQEEQEDMAESISKMETELRLLHESWRVIDEDRHRVEQQRDCLARRAKASEERAVALEAQLETLGQQAEERGNEREALRKDLGVSEADVEALQPLVEAAEQRAVVLRGQSNELLARLYVSQSEVEALQSRVEMEEHRRAVLEERERQLQAERRERRRAAQQVAERVREEFEDEFAEERRAAGQRERELKLAIATMAQRQKAAEESIKRLTGEGTPEPPKWYRSAVPTMLTRRKRLAHGMVPGVPALRGGELPPSPHASSVGEEQGEARSPASSSAVKVEGSMQASATTAEEAGEEDSFGVDEEAAALLQAMGVGVQAAAPELLFASGLPSVPEGKLGAGGVGDASKYVPATCKIDTNSKCLSIQVLAPTGVTHKISLVGVNSITRPEDARGAVDIAGTGAAEKGARRLRITAPDEDGASALVAAITLPDRILPGSALVSGRTSIAHTAESRSVM